MYLDNIFLTVYLVQGVFRSLDFGAAAALPVGGRPSENTGFFLQLLLTEKVRKVKKPEAKFFVPDWGI
jgi:hypothetical protein